MAQTFKYADHDVNFPAVNWTELVTTADYVLNRVRKSSIEGKTPHEVWNGQKLQIKYLRIVA